MGPLHRTTAIAEGSFRSDLFYRLNVFPIHVPPLRKRREDIPILVEYFVKRFAEKMAKRIRQIDKRTLDLCDRYSWPGNIRELQNIVERSVILCTGDTFSIDEAWLPSQAPRRADGSGPLHRSSSSLGLRNADSRQHLDNVNDRVPTGRCSPIRLLMPLRVP